MNQPPPTDHRDPGADGTNRSPHLDEHHCLDLLQGLLAPAEEEAILGHLADCPACEELLQINAAAGERLAATRVLRILPDGELLLERRGSAASSAPSSTSTWRSRLARSCSRLATAFDQPGFRLAGGLAAAALAILLVVWPPAGEDPMISGLRPLPPYSFQLQSRLPSATGAEGDLARGLEAYDNRDFALAIVLLTRAEAPPDDPVSATVRRIYLGSALAWQRRPAEAVAVLTPVPFARVPERWGNEAHWTLFLALQASNRVAAADSLLQILAGKSGEIGERARRHLHH